METLSQRREQLMQRIAAAATLVGRQSSEVRLLAVSKKHPAEAIRTLHLAGQIAFGENYVDEALIKIGQLGDLDLQWHFIGPIQSNKTRAIAERFDWVQTIDREKVARRLSDQRPADLPPLQCLIQVRIGGEASKSGCEPEQLAMLASLVNSLPHLHLRGLMTIPPVADSIDRQRGWFAQLGGLYQELEREGLVLDTLSMGMTDDLEAAIAEGATLVRIGTALFGPRPG